MVSWVVKVFEAMMKRVVSGESVFRVSAICVPSTFDTKWGLKVRLPVGSQRLGHHDRPQIRPSDPDVDDVCNRLARITLPVS